MLKNVIFILLFQTILFGADFYNNGFHFHGKFCGKEVPELNANSRQEEFQMLNDMEPIDVIDKACKEHDLCYLKKGDSNKECDKELVAKVDKLHNRLDSESCRRLSKSIAYFFTLKTDNPIEVLDSDDSTALKMVKMPTTAFRNMVNTFSISTTAAVNYGYSKPFGYVIDNKNNSERRKEILQIFPSRYKVCTLNK